MDLHPGITLDQIAQHALVIRRQVLHQNECHAGFGINRIAEKKASNAARPPADAPMPTTGKALLGGGCERDRSERDDSERGGSERGGSERDDSERGGSERDDSERGGSERDDSERGGSERDDSERGGSERSRRSVFRRARGMPRLRTQAEEDPFSVSARCPPRLQAQAVAIAAVARLADSAQVAPIGSWRGTLDTTVSPRTIVLEWSPCRRLSRVA